MSQADEGLSMGVKVGIAIGVLVLVYVIYTMNKKEEEEEPTTIAVVEDTGNTTASGQPTFTYLGCYKDDGITKKFKKKVALNVTAAECASLAKAHGYDVIGLQNYNGTTGECWSGGNISGGYEGNGPSANCVSVNGINYGKSKTNSVYRLS